MRLELRNSTSSPKQSLGSMLSQVSAQQQGANLGHLGGMQRGLSVYNRTRHW